MNLPVRPVAAGPAGLRGCHLVIAALPSYAELPVRPGAPRGSSWGVETEAGEDALARVGGGALEQATVPQASPVSSHRLKVFRILILCS